MINFKNAMKPIVIFLLSMILICTTLYAGEDVVLTNNGDYNRITWLSSLHTDSDGNLKILLGNKGFWGNIHQILTTPEDTSEYPTSQLLFVRFSVALSYAGNTMSGIAPDTYHLMCLSMMYVLMYALALTFLLTQISIKPRFGSWIVTAIALIVLCDIGYVSYFNSLYAEGLQHILLVAGLGFFIRSWKHQLSIAETVLFALVLVLFGQSKLFNIPLAIVMALVAIIIALQHSLTKWRMMVSVASAVLTVAILVGNYLSIPEWISTETTYNAVFFGVLKDCDDATAQEYLADIRVNPDLAELKNTHRYVTNIHPIRDNYPVEQAEAVSKFKLLGFYAGHPSVTLQKFTEIAGHCSHIRNIFFMDASYMEDAFRCCWWSNLREHLAFDTVLWNFLTVFLFLALLWYRFRKSGMKTYGVFVLVCLLSGAFAYSFFVPYVSNGEADLAKHMYLFIELIDLALLGILVMSFSLSGRTGSIFAMLLVLVTVVSVVPYQHFETVSFGGNLWYVIGEDETCKTLLSKDVILEKSFHPESDNQYKTSEIHRWLNEEFLGGFSFEEREMLLKKDEKIIVSSQHMDRAEGGNRDFYCSAFPKRVASNGAEAYYQTVSGYVFLPTAEQITHLARNDFPVALSEKYWLSTPYFNNGSKSRYVHPDGLVYFENTQAELGIRPVIYLKK